MKEKKKKSVLIPLLLFLSALLALCPLYVDLSLSINKNKKSKEFNQKLEIVDKKKDPSKINLNENDLSVIAMLYVPSIDVSLPVYDTSSDSEEDSLRKMAKAENNGVALWYQLDKLNEGKGSRSLLSSHNGLSNNDLFSNLEHLGFGDKFYLKTLDGEIKAYEVFEIDKAQPNGDLVFKDKLYNNNKIQRLVKKENSIYEISNDEYKGYDTIFKTKTNRKSDEAFNAFYTNKEEEFVTLQTCVPVFQNTHRLLVTGKRVQYNNESLPYYDRMRFYMILFVLALIIAMTSLIKIILNIIYNCKINKKKD